MESIFNQEEIDSLAQSVMADFSRGRKIDDLSIGNKPEKAEIRSLVDGFFRLVYPGYYRERAYRVLNPQNSLVVLFEDVFHSLYQQVLLALDFCTKRGSMALEDRQWDSYRICCAFFGRFPAIRELVESDLHAAFDGDPAAGCMEEIVLAYPGLMASTVYRLAHELYLLQIPVVPRLMSEYAHAETGIDIHPGAVIGSGLFIDHGTGTVIGETAVIGNNVKIYQGVTLGALSTRGGQRLSGVKRHPTIEDNVTIYSGASVLGGKTVIGRNSVIGGNTFITSSVPPNTRVSIKNPEMEYRTADSKIRKEEISQGEEWFYVI